MSSPYKHTSVDDEAATEMAQAAAQTKIIGIALLMGCVSFLAVAVFVSGVSKEIYEGAGIITWLGVGMGVMMFVMSIVVPGVIVKGQVGRGANHTVSSLCSIFRTKSIIAMAMSEGAAFFNIVAYFLDGQLLSLGVVALLLLQIVMRIPSSYAVENFVSDQQRVLGQ